MLCQRYLVIDRADLSDLGVAPGAVVPADELLDAGLELVEGGEGVAVVELVLEDAPERLGGCVVEARSGAAHRPRQPHVEAFLDDVLRRELRPSVAVNPNSG